MESYLLLEIARDVVFQGATKVVIKYKIKMDAKLISPDAE